MSDAKKKGYDPIFDEIFKDFMMPSISAPRSYPLEPVRKAIEANPIDFVPDPFPVRTKAASEALRDLVVDIQIRMGPPKPITPYDEGLYDMANSLGFKPVIDNKFGLDWGHNILLTDPLAPPAERVLCLAHEIGHAQRLRAGLLDRDIFFRWNSRSATTPPPLTLAKHVIAEEIMAWRWGMRTLRRMGCRFSDNFAVRQFRQMCLATYRMSTQTRIGAIKRLKVKG